MAQVLLFVNIPKQSHLLNLKLIAVTPAKSSVAAVLASRAPANSVTIAIIFTDASSAPDVSTAFRTTPEQKEHF